MKITIIDQEGKERVIEAEGQEVRIDLSKKEDRGSKWDRVGKDSLYYCVTDSSMVQEIEMQNFDFDINLFNNFNYCRDKKTMELRAKRERLMHEMEVWRDKNDPEKVDWNDINNIKYYLLFNNNDIEVDGDLDLFYFNQIYFSSKKIAEKAREVFGARLLELAQEEMR